MSVALLLAAALGVAPPALVGVRMGESEGRPALQLVTAAPLGEVRFAREGAQIVLTFQASAPTPLRQPEIAPPVQAARLARVGERLELRLTVAADVPYFLRREGNLLQLVFDVPRAAAAVAPRTPPPPRDAPAPAAAPAAPEPSPAATASVPAAPGEVGALVGQLFPAPGPSMPDAGSPAVPTADGTSASPAPPEAAHDGVLVGPAVLRPSVDVLYVDGRGTVIQSQRANEDAYLEIRPTLGAELPLGSGALHAAYQARLRTAAQLPEVRHPSHVVDANLSYPLGQLVTLRANEHYARGVLEATEVDPGREYFFRLAPFRRNAVGVGLDVEAAARLKVTLGGSLNTVNLDQGSGFFDYEERTGTAGLTYELSPTLVTGLSYVRDHVPASVDRPLVASDGSGAQFTLQGTVTPLLTAQVGLGYTSRESPAAPDPGRRFRGFTADVHLRQEISRSTSVGVSALRAVELSGFGDNAFYVTEGLRGEINAGAPFELVVLGGGGVRWNHYRLPATATGGPREDRIVDWTVGAGRPVTRWSFVRADYTRERRHSNLSGFETTNWSFVAQLGLGWLGTGVRP